MYQKFQIWLILCSYIICTSLMHRPSHLTYKRKIHLGSPGQTGDVIAHGLRPSCVSPPTHPYNECSHCFTTWLTVLVSGRRYIIASQTTSNYITWSTKPSWFFSHTLQNMGGPGTRLARENSCKMLHSTMHIMPQFNVATITYSACTGTVLEFNWPHVPECLILQHFSQNPVWLQMWVWHKHKPSIAGNFRRRKLSWISRMGEFTEKTFVEW